jgi:hypothetical protein
MPTSQNRDRVRRIERGRAQLLRNWGPEDGADAALQSKEFGRGDAIGDLQYGVADRQAEAAGTDAAGVQVEYALFLEDRRLMRVAEDHDADPCVCRLQVEFVQTMQHVNEAAAELDDFGNWKLGAGAGAIDVAANGSHWRDLAQFVEDGWVADIACMQDVVNAGETRREFGAEQTVGVGEDGNTKGRGTHDESRSPEVVKRTNEGAQFGFAQGRLCGSDKRKGRSALEAVAQT